MEEDFGYDSFGDTGYEEEDTGFDDQAYYDDLQRVVEEAMQAQQVLNAQPTPMGEAAVGDDAAKSIEGMTVPLTPPVGTETEIDDTSDVDPDDPNDNFNDPRIRPGWHESSADSAALARDVINNIGRAPNIDYESLPATGNVEDRREGYTPPNEEMAQVWEDTQRAEADRGRQERLRGHRAFDPRNPWRSRPDDIWEQREEDRVNQDVILGNRLIEELGGLPGPVHDINNPFGPPAKLGDASDEKQFIPRTVEDVINDFLRRRFQ